MDYWDFISDNNWFGIKLPGNWAEYDDDEDLFAFFNTEKWSGNLRITHFRIENVESGTDEANQRIHSTLNNKPGALLIKLGELNAAFYSQETINGECIIYFWVTGAKNDWFICSFTFDKPFLGTDWHNNELIVVSEILASIKIID
jgi:hypothetical protein